ncbi:ATP-grasp domain-containing protein [Pectobacterium polaris]|uniref:ATP-grasp domain-containing protein n=1 Tax=Pectobacterium polaris TaxID=2042057 RepID=UPI0015828900|nr:ATP-grasp domain-containing protein [Pectobacterium polaris]
MKVIVLAGGYDQIALIQELKSRDCYVILVDYNNEPIAASYADKHYNDSTMDIERVRVIAETEQVKLITTACTDQALFVAAFVSEKLSLPFPFSSKLACSLTNKKWMKEVLIKNEIPTARHILHHGIIDWKELERLSYPMVFKPVDANSSKGVSKVESVDELDMAFTYALKNSRSSIVLSEEFIEGQELSVDSWVDSNGEATVLMVSRSLKNASEENGFPIIASLYPARNKEYIEGSITPLIKKIANAFNLSNTPLLVQVIASSNDIKVVELSARMGGGCKHHFLRHVTGVDTIKLLVDVFLSKKIGFIEPKYQEKFYLMKYIYAENGVFSGVEGMGKLKENGVIVDYYPTRKNNSIISGCSTSTDRVGAMLLTASNYEEIFMLLEQCYEKISVPDKNSKVELKKIDFHSIA